MGALDLVAEWPVPTASVAVMRGTAVVGSVGDDRREQRLASISKPMTAWAVLVAVEEGIVALADEIDERGATLRHLLAHAGGYPFDGPVPIAAPETTRIYSNSGIERAADLVAAAAEMAFGDYLREALFTPLGMSATELRGSPAHAVWSTLGDTCRFVAEVQSPTLIHGDTAADAHRIQYPDLAGIVPGVGRYERCPWGLGFEVRGAKQPHWTGTTNSPRTFGHFGGSGTMFWIDPDVDLAVVALADRPFDEWRDEALRRWPELSDAVIAEHAGTGGGPR